jgi:hypothetical protein
LNDFGGLWTFAKRFANPGVADSRRQYGCMGKRSREERERVSTAYHEAGHAVAGERLGFTSAGVSIASRGAKRGGARVFGDWQTLKEARAEIVCLLAGYAADVKHGTALREARNGCGADFAEARRVSRFVGEPIARGRARAAAFVRERRNWRAIDLIALQLLASTKISGAAVSTTVEIADRRLWHYWQLRNHLRVLVDAG